MRSALPWHTCICSNSTDTWHTVRVVNLCYFILLWFILLVVVSNEISLAYRNTKWVFLDGVKLSGAPPPRKVIVQQCIRDKGILDILCSYVSTHFIFNYDLITLWWNQITDQVCNWLQASPTKKFQPSKHVISFCTAVFIEVLGTVMTVNDDLVKIILPFVVSGLQPGIRGFSDHKVRFHIEILA